MPLRSLCEDNGNGLPANDGNNGGSGRKRRGMGLKIMDYRARLIGGNLEIMNNPGSGVVVVCSYQQRQK